MKNLQNYDEFLNEQQLSDLQKEYREYFKAMLKKYDVTSPSKLSDEKKKEFFNEVKVGWVKGRGITAKYKKLLFEEL